MTPCDLLVHSALEPPPAGGAMPVAEAPITDRARLGVLLQGAALLAHLEAARWRLEDHWGGAMVDSAGLLRGVAAGPAAPARHPARRLVELAALLFGDRDVSGRGEARAVARRLVAGWRGELVTIRPDQAVARLLDLAAPLWRRELGAARATLGAVRVDGDRRRPWVAGPSWFRRAVLARAGGERDLWKLLSSARLSGLWFHPPEPSSTAARWRAAARLDSHPSAGAEEERLASARACHQLGRFDRALAVLAGATGCRVAILRARALLWLDRPGAAWRELAKLDAGDRSGRERLALARVAVACLGRRGDHRAAAARAERELRSVAGWLRPEAHLLAAEAAAARRDLGALRRHLRRSRVVLEQPVLAWRWYRAAGSGALAHRRGATAAVFYGRALAAGRRCLPPFEAALLWEGTARGRRLAGDLARAERAAAHAARLHVSSGGPRPTRHCLARLAEMRLRRGRHDGLEPAIAAATDLAPEIDAVALAARRELARGHPRRALERLRGAGDRLTGERAALAARALGWMGERRRARRMLRAGGPRSGDWFEAEERPPLWALAGERGRARAVATGPAGLLWKALLAGEKACPGQWAATEGLGGYRLARLVHDAELLAPGFCPATRIERAARRLTRAGAGPLAARLEAADRSAWQALADFLDRGQPDEAALGSLLAAVGAPHARLWLERDDERVELVAGRGGEVELETAVDGGRFVLAAPVPNPRLPVLLRLVADRWPPPRGHAPAVRTGIVGDSPVLRAALERAAVLARSALPVLILGETGTGKELLARRVHASSDRAAGSFLPVNCAAVARDLLLSDLFGHRRGAFTGADRDRAGVFESARGGTVFLDEIGDLPPAAQGALLRVLQEGEVQRLGETMPRRVDARIVAATHRDLAALVRRGRFREDLYFRLEAAAVELPPLRRRGGDVVLLTEHFLRRSRPGAPVALSTGARSKLEAYEWPGNVRELENALAVAVAVSGGGPIEAGHLELDRGNGDGHRLGYHARVARYRRRLIEEALEASGGNRAAAARRIGLSRQAMTYLVRSLGITEPLRRPNEAGV